MQTYLTNKIRANTRNNKCTVSSKKTTK